MKPNKVLCMFVLIFFSESCLLELIAKTRFVNQHNACALDHVTLKKIY
jgi:hypothetical protein